MLTAVPAFLAGVTAHTYSVSRPYTRNLIESPLLITLHYFPLAGETRCEMRLAHTIPNAWLIDLDSIRFIPMMIGRIIISLKKVASSQHRQLSIEVPTGSRSNPQDTNSRPVENIQLSVLGR